MSDGLLHHAQAPAVPPGPREETSTPSRALNPITVALAAAIATVGAVWPLTGVFHGALALALLVGLALCGPAAVAVGSRGGQVGRLGTVLPAIALASLWGLMAATEPQWWRSLLQAVREGIVDPPVALTPGWLLLAGTLALVVGTSSTLLAVAVGRGAVAALLPGAALMVLVAQGSANGSSAQLVPALLLVLLGLAVGQAADTARDAGGRVNVRRLLMSMGLLGLLGAMLFGLMAAGLLTPPDVNERPQPARPPAGVPLADAKTPLYRIRTTTPLVLRLGAASTFDGQQFVRPAYDPGALPRLGGGSLGTAPTTVSGAYAVQVEVLSARVGRFVPTLPGTYTVEGLPETSRVDVDAGMLRLPVSAEPGLSYMMRAVNIAATAQQKYAPAPAEPVGSAAAEAISTWAAAGDSPWRQLNAYRTAVRDRQKSEPTPGGPQPVNVDTVRASLNGTTLTGYQRAAAEALVARWLGLDSRVAYGYLCQTPGPRGCEITGEQAGAWLELRTAEGQWAPVTDDPRSNTPPVVSERVVPNGQYLGQLLVPQHVPAEGLWQRAALWWLGLYGAIAALGLAVWALIPTLLRTWRRASRRRAGEKLGPVAAVAAAYADFRDNATDLGIGDPTMTPLEFVATMTPDADHEQLAWLVTRALWGDLRDDLTDDDVSAAVTLSRWMRRRMRQGQSMARRTWALGSWQSLRHPWHADLPNPVPTHDLMSQPSQRWQPPAWLARTGHAVSWWRLLRGLAALVVASVLVGIPWLVGIDRVDLAARSPEAAALARPEAPRGFDGYTVEENSQGAPAFRRWADHSLIEEPGWFTLRKDGVPVALIQTSVYKQGVAGEQLRLRSSLLTELGMTDVSRVGRHVIYGRRDGDRVMVLLFSESGTGFTLLHTTGALSQAERLLAQLREVQLGGSPSAVPDVTAQRPADVRRQPYGSADGTGEIGEDGEMMKK